MSLIKLPVSFHKILADFLLKNIDDGPVVKTSSNTEGVGWIPGQEDKIPQASWPKNQNIKQKQYCNKFYKDFENSPCQEKKKKKI